MSIRTALETLGKQVAWSFSCNGVSYTARDVASASPSFDGDILRSVMRELTLDLDGVPTSRFEKGQAIQNLTLSVTANNSTVTKTYETFYIKEITENKENGGTILECYDILMNTMVPFDGSITTTGKTVKQLLDAICTKFSITKGYTSFTNGSVELESERYNENFTYRDVLDDIAAASGGTICIKGGKLCVLYPTESNITLDTSNMKKLEIGEMFGPVNALVLARTPQEDDIYRRDDLSILANGLYEIKIENCQLIDEQRDDFIDGIWSRVHNFGYRQYTLESFGIGDLDICDIFTISVDNEEYETLMMFDELTVGQSVGETSYIEKPNKGETDYSAASKSDKALLRVELRVDKVQGEITSEVERASSAEGTLSSRITQTATDITSEVSRASATEGELSSRITQTAETITSEISRATAAEGTLSSLITQTATEVSSKVSKDSIISEINQSAEEVKISASKLTLTGLVTISALGTAGAVTINGGNITADTISANTIKANSWEGLNIGGSGGYLNNSYINTAYIRTLGLPPAGSSTLNVRLSSSGVSTDGGSTYTDWDTIKAGGTGTAVFG